mmetsp:Transcript_359/g.379  ORF Transcript_359/g.379 Transcript_359/m.379 type:complete len:268 (+) Transcript_359:121-924(+)
MTSLYYLLSIILSISWSGEAFTLNQSAGTSYRNNVVLGYNAFSPLRAYESSPRRKISLRESATSTEENELTEEKIGELIEVTFIQACMQLSTGHVDILKLFLVAVKSAYERKIPTPQLTEVVAEADDRKNSANRLLSSEEISLRTGWINLAYLTFECLDRIEGTYDSVALEKLEKSLDGSIDVREQYKMKVEEKVREFLNKGDSSDCHSQVTDVTDDDPIKAAIIAYNLKAVDLSLIIVKEERIANDSGGLDGNGVGPPRPPIPGAF